jgi:hypothetical protein
MLGRVSAAVCAAACLANALRKQINAALMTKALDVFEVSKRKINSI